MQAHVRRVYKFGSFKLDAEERILSKEGKPLALTPKAFDTLVLLVENSGRLVGKEELLERVWHGSFVEENSLNRSISILRKTLGESPNDTKFIETVPKHGYRFAGGVVEADSDGHFLILEKHTAAEIISEEEITDSGAAETKTNLPLKDVTQNLAHRTGDIAGARTTSSAEYVVSEIKRHKTAVSIGLFAVVLAIASLVLPNLKRAPALTEKDTILLADFVNTTGDQVFDGTLKRALAVQLGQSPFLDILSDERGREALQSMGRSPDERVTREVAREICQRQGLKALLAGYISSLGIHYSMTLETVNAQTGDVIARGQAEAASKEEVLSALGKAALQLREKLGESLASIQRFDAPIEQATTSSLEAFKAVALGDEYRAKGAFDESIPFYKRAVELDPNFAAAYARLSVMYSNTRQLELSGQYAEKAFALRDRVSERERFYIDSRYYIGVSGDTEKALEVFSLWKKTYPRDFVPLNNSAVLYSETGQFEKTVEEAREAMRLNPNMSLPFVNLGFGYLGLNRFDEGKAVIEQGLAHSLDFLVFHWVLYGIAFINADSAGMQQQIEWARGRPNEYVMVHQQAAMEASSGRLGRARELYHLSIESARTKNAEVAAITSAQAALMEATVGDCQRGKQDVGKALLIKRTKASLNRSALALALCGEAGQAQRLIDELSKRFPNDTYTNVMWLPTIRAAIEINRSNAAQAVQLLQLAGRYEGGAEVGFWPAYLRGLAYLRQRAGAEALAEFRKILDHKGVIFIRLNPAAQLYALAHLGVARAAAITGDTAASRQAYQNFFAFWKEADQGISILQGAKAEYDKLK